MSRSRRFATLLACVLCSAAALGQDRGANRTKYAPPAYPEEAGKKDAQGNVLLLGRIDAKGNVTDLHALLTTRKDFVQPAVDAVAGWKFDPALRNGKPIDIPLNAGVRFRISGKARGAIPQPMLGDIAIFPADASGAKTAPDAFPLRRGKDPALRAEVQLDVPPVEDVRTLTIKVEAQSPSGKKYPVFQPPLAVLAKATDVRFPVVAQVGADWEDGVWLLLFTVDGVNAGGGQFWLAKDPATFKFVVPKL